MGRYPIELRAKIMTLRDAGYSYHAIAGKVDKRASSISQFVCTFKDRSNLTEQSGRGRGRLLSPRDERAITRVMLSGECGSPAEIAQQAANIGLSPVSASTVRRALARQGYSAYVQKPKPSLSKKNLRERLKWAKERRHWTKQDWEKILFSDESKVVLMRTTSRS